MPWRLYREKGGVMNILMDKVLYVCRPYFAIDILVDSDIDGVDILTT
jgi:hypothetical protein